MTTSTEGEVEKVSTAIDIFENILNGPHWWEIRVWLYKHGYIDREDAFVFRPLYFGNFAVSHVTVVSPGAITPWGSRSTTFNSKFVRESRMATIVEIVAHEFLHQSGAFWESESDEFTAFLGPFISEYPFGKLPWHLRSGL